MQKNRKAGKSLSDARVAVVYLQYKRATELLVRTLLQVGGEKDGDRGQEEEGQKDEGQKEGGPKEEKGGSSEVEKEVYELKLLRFAKTIKASRHVVLFSTYSEVCRIADRYVDAIGECAEGAPRPLVEALAGPQSQSQCVMGEGAEKRRHWVLSFPENALPLDPAVLGDFAPKIKFATFYKDLLPIDKEDPAVDSAHATSIIDFADSAEMSDWLRSAGPSLRRHFLKSSTHHKEDPHESESKKPQRTWDAFDAFMAHIAGARFLPSFNSLPSATASAPPSTTTWELGDGTGVSHYGQTRYYEPKVPGLFYMRDFVDEREEQMILQSLDKMPWNEKLRRRVQHYGHTFLYENIDIDKSVGAVPPIPAFLHPLITRIRTAIATSASDPNSDDVSDFVDQLTVNEYKPGEGIGTHVDRHSAFTNRVIVLSLGSGIEMAFKRPNGVDVPIFLERRSLLVFADLARYGLQHGIKRRKTDIVNGVRVSRGTRVSLTFRKLNWENNFSCKKCGFPELCDTQNPQIAAILPDRLGPPQSFRLEA